MKLIRRALVGALIGALLWLCVTIFLAIFFQEKISFEKLIGEVGIVSLIGAIIGMASLASRDEGIRNLRDMQAEIESGEYIAKIEREYIKKKERSRHNEENEPSEIILEHHYNICAHDGTIWEKEEEDEEKDKEENKRKIPDCPNPNHPNPPPIQVPNIVFLYLSVGAICFSLAYSIYINEALLTLVVTTLLLITSATVFTILFLVLVTLTKVLRIQVITTKLLSIVVSILSALFAMITVSLWLGQFPLIIWWVIELAIAFLIEIFLSDGLSGWAIRWEKRYKDQEAVSN